MFKYLTLNKVLKDCLALLKVHFIYIALMFSVVAIPNYLVNFGEEFTVYQGLYLLFNIVVVILINMVSISLAASSFLYDESTISDKFKDSLTRLIPFVLLSLLGRTLAILGLFMLVIPGLVVAVLFSMAKIHFIVHRTALQESIIGVIKLFKREYIGSISKILLMPFLLLLLIVQIILYFVGDQEIIFKYLPLSVIVINPIIICYSTSLYFNLVKENQLDSTN